MPPKPASPPAVLGVDRRPGRSESALAGCSASGPGEPGGARGRRWRDCASRARLVLLTCHDEVSVRKTVLAHGADDLVLLRILATDLPAAVVRLIRGVVGARGDDTQISIRTLAHADLP